MVALAYEEKISFRHRKTLSLRGGKMLLTAENLHFKWKVPRGFDFISL
jgi:hypothetical protein